MRQIRKVLNTTPILANVVDNLTITLNDNYDFDITKDTNATLLYFFNDIADLDYDKLNQ